MWTEHRVYGPTPEQVREQRRYEIARDVMAAVMTNNGEPTPGYSERIAAGSVIAAEALVAERERRRRDADQVATVRAGRF